MQIDSTMSLYLCNQILSAMKRIAISFILLFISFCIFAQTDHVKFMGIPLNGTIQQFHQKLVAKGCRHDAKLSSLLSKGTRVFKGSFADKNADIFVYYDESTKIVYRAKAVIICSGDNIRDVQFEDFKNLLDTKYGTLLSNKGTKENYDAYSYPIFSETTDYMIGRVDLYVSKQEFGYHEYTLHVDYFDDINTKKHDRKRLEDI